MSCSCRRSLSASKCVMVSAFDCLSVLPFLSFPFLFIRRLAVCLVTRVPGVCLSHVCSLLRRSSSLPALSLSLPLSPACLLSPPAPSPLAFSLSLYLLSSTQIARLIETREAARKRGRQRSTHAVDANDTLVRDVDDDGDRQAADTDVSHTRTHTQRALERSVSLVFVVVVVVVVAVVTRSLARSPGSPSIGEGYGGREAGSLLLPPHTGRHSLLMPLLLSLSSAFLPLTRLSRLACLFLVTLAAN